MRPLPLAAISAMLAAGLPAQYGNPTRTWAFLAAKYDADDNGKISKKEYPRGERQFDNLDRNGNGVLTRDDCEVGSQFRVQQSLGAKADADLDMVVTRAEWQKLWTLVEPGEDGTHDIQRFLELIQWARARKAGRRSGGGGGRSGGGGRGRHRRQRFESIVYALDSDGDGVVKASDLARLFAWLDKDGDDTLSKAEVRTSHDVRRRPPASPPDPNGGPAVGSMAPDFELPDGRDPSQSMRLSKLHEDRPVVLVFGSYTDPKLRIDADQLSRLYHDHQDEARFLLVYVREARAIDSYTLSHFEVVEDPITDAERIALAAKCVAAHPLPMPTVVDRIDDVVSKAYGSWPVRSLLVGKGGRVLFASRPGDLDLDGLSRAIESASPRKR